MRTKILLAFVVLSCTLVTAFALSSGASVIRDASRAHDAVPHVSARAQNPMKLSMSSIGKRTIDLFVDQQGLLTNFGFARTEAIQKPRTSSQNIATGIWHELRQCESGNDYATNTGNGYYGAYQFLPSTWRAIGYSGMPNTASVDVQNSAASVLEALYGWNAWPQCATALGLR